jgi:hypothetical protein
MPRDMIEPPEHDALVAYHCGEAVRLMAQARKHLRYLARAHHCPRTRVNAARVAAQLQHDEQDMRIVLGVPEA